MPALAIRRVDVSLVGLYVHSPEHGLQVGAQAWGNGTFGAAAPDAATCSRLGSTACANAARHATAHVEAAANGHTAEAAPAQGSAAAPEGESVVQARTSAV